MLYHFLYPLAGEFHGLNLFRYITFRAGGALLTALFLGFWMGPFFIRWLQKKQKEGQPIREDGPQSHLISKKGTPTMGGLLMLFSITVSTLLWGRLDSGFVWIVLWVTLSFGFLGAVDDYLKLTRRNPKGVSGRAKIVVQLGVVAVSYLWVHYLMPAPFWGHLAVPFLKSFLIDLGWFYLPFMACVIVGTSNAVNLTDGLDGLATGPIVLASVCFLVISYVVGNHVFAHYLQIPFIPGAGELAVPAGAIIGAGLGFLWFNAPPARIFMGDTGSLALGGALGIFSVLTMHELVLFIIGGLFVAEAVSVIMQVGYFKMTRRRLFLMAPIHHHFEKKGWAEQTIVIRFWIISVIFALLGLATLKLR